MEQIDQIASLTLSAIGGVMFAFGAVRIWRRGMQGLVTRHADGSAVTPEEKRAQMTGLWRAMLDPAHRGDLALLVGGFLISAGFVMPLWWGIRALTG